ncbi:MAG: N-acetylmuramoyl-L-alanine amidase [Pseudomonadota bacterium]
MSGKASLWLWPSGGLCGGARLGLGACVAIIGAFVSAGLTWASEDAPAPVLQDILFKDGESHARLSLKIAPAVETEIVLRGGAEAVTLLLPDLQAAPSLATPDGVSIEETQQGVAMRIAPLSADGPLSMRRIEAREGEIAAFAIGVEAAITALAPHMPVPDSRPSDFEDRVRAAAARRAEDFTVVIDPGHGGHDPGATVEGVVEKRLTLVMARRLALRIDSVPGMRAVLTREGDRFLTLGARLRRAVAAGADAFLSLHADTVSEGDASGMAVYTLTPTLRDAVAGEITSEAPRDAILRGVDLAGAGDDVTRILVDLAQRRTSVQAEALAAAILNGMGAEVRLLHSEPHRRANFRVLRSVDFPAVLVELGFLSNDGDRERLQDRRWQVLVAERMSRAIADWRRELATSSRQN